MLNHRATTLTCLALLLCSLVILGTEVGGQSRQIADDQIEIEHSQSPLQPNFSGMRRWHDSEGGLFLVLHEHYQKSKKRNKFPK